MPKVVDHEQRRRELAEAVLRVVLRHGVAGASVRAVAAEAGWSTGALRYYFPSQRELRAFAAEVSALRLRERVEARVAARRPDLPLLEGAATVVEELIPLDDERRQDYSLWLSLAELERGLPAAARSSMWDDQRMLCRAVVLALAGLELPGPVEERAGRPHPDPRVEAWAEYLHVFTDGLASQAMLLPHAMPADRVRSAVRSFLAEIASRF